MDSVQALLFDLDSLIQTNGVDTAAIESQMLGYMQFLDSILPLSQQLVTQMEDDYLEAVALLRTEVVAVSAESEVEIWEKSIMELYLRYVTQGYDSISASEWTWVQELASLCPKYQDFAVFLARGLYSVHDPLTENDDDLACFGQLPIVANNQNLNPAFFQIAPNPASDQIHCSVPNEIRDLEVQLISIDGRVLRPRIIDLQKSTLSISTSELPQGIYVLRFSKNQEVVFSSKIQIIR
jgi:hypothetical protein